MKVGCCRLSRAFHGVSQLDSLAGSIRRQVVLGRNWLFDRPKKGNTFDKCRALHQVTGWKLILGHRELQLTVCGLQHTDFGDRISRYKDSYVTQRREQPYHILQSHMRRSCAVVNLKVSFNLGSWYIRSKIGGGMFLSYFDPIRLSTCCYNSEAVNNHLQERLVGDMDQDASTSRADLRPLGREPIRCGRVSPI